MKDNETTLDSIRQTVDRFITERNWQAKQTPKNVAGSVSIEASELYEVFQWADNDEVNERLKDPTFKDKVRMEAADVLFYLVDLANACDFDLTEAFAEKLKLLEIKYPANVDLNHDEYHRIKEVYRQNKT